MPVQAASTPGNGRVALVVLGFVVLLVLRLAHVIAWSWWWITAPLWGMALLGVAAFLVTLGKRR
ncbi:MAG: hypothetical protein JWN95_304 [Frankiales bacterium]|nr:hypothetical protein [Frankiales bacterium]